jgi:hypothetical protein
MPINHIHPHKEKRMNPPNELIQETVPLKSRIWVSIGDAACAMLNTFIVSIGLTYYFTSYPRDEPVIGCRWYGCCLGSGMRSMTHCLGTSATGPNQSLAGGSLIFAMVRH